MRIASLVPSATEALFALGLGGDVVAVTHECDHPPEVAALPKLTSSLVDPDLRPAEIDRAVTAATASGGSLYELDEATLAELRPDLIVTQALCAVCAVSYDDVRAVAERLPSRPQVVSLDPTTLDGVLGDLAMLGEATGRPDTGTALRASLQRRLDSLRTGGNGVRPAGAGERPDVLALEWLDPPYVAGHWIPEMIELAGGRDVLGESGGKSRTIGWRDAAAACPDVVVVMPCGLYVDEAAQQAAAYASELSALGAAKVFAVDAAGSYSRPGPRLVDGAELLAHLLHGDAYPAPAGLGFRELTVPAAAG